MSEPEGNRSRKRKSPDGTGCSELAVGDGNRGVAPTSRRLADTMKSVWFLRAISPLNRNEYSYRSRRHYSDRNKTSITSIVQGSSVFSNEGIDRHLRTKSTEGSWVA